MSLSFSISETQKVWRNVRHRIYTGGGHNLALNYLPRVSLGIVLIEYVCKATYMVTWDELDTGPVETQEKILLN